MVCFELFHKLFGVLSEKREDNIIAGLSMGGYGAMKLALTCPEQYGACISLSGSLDVTRKGRSYNLSEWQSIFGYDIKSALELEGGEHDLFALVEGKRDDVDFPSIYMWCGTEDTLIDTNRLFDQHLTNHGVHHRFRYSEGDHSWKWWDMHIQEGLKWVLES